MTSNSINKSVSNRLSVAAVGLLVSLMASAGAASAATFTGIYDLSGGADGAKPQGGVLIDDKGIVYGTTTKGGSVGADGAVFKLTPPISGTKWVETTLYKFSGGADGAKPQAALIADKSGNLYGTASAGGTGNGVVFKLTPTQIGTWTETVLYTFKGGQDGSAPYARLAIDSSGNLYGTTTKGGHHNNGVVFELTAGVSAPWTESLLYEFSGGKDGSAPYAGVAFDTAGNLYGTTSNGGASHGVVYRLLPATGSTWTEEVLYKFKGGSDGAIPYAPITIGSSNELYGTTLSGGSSNLSGVVFELTPASSAPWVETVLYRFKGGSDGSQPYAGVIEDKAGNLYGATTKGGSAQVSGVVFELTPGSGGTFSETVLHTFTGGADGGIPHGDLAFDEAGSVYGTTAKGGKNNGVVFEVAP